MKALITFIGGEACGDVGSTTWGNADTGMVKFPLGRAVLVDSEAESGAKRDFLKHLITKARVNPFFECSDASDETDVQPVQVVERKPEPRLKTNPKRGAAAKAA